MIVGEKFATKIYDNGGNFIVLYIYKSRSGDDCWILTCFLGDGLHL